MATVTTPVEGFNGKVAGVVFSDGVGSTDDDNALAYFRRHGYTIGDADPGPAFPEGDPAKTWTKPQLIAYAEANAIDLGEAKSKDDLVALLVSDGSDGS